MNEIKELFDKRHIHDIELYDLTEDEANKLYDAIVDKKNITNNPKISLLLMKYYKNYEAPLILKLVRKGSLEALFVMATLCDKNDRAMYFNEFFNDPKIRDDKNKFNYYKFKSIMVFELNKKAIKNKNLVKEAFEYLKLIKDDYCKSIPYYKYISYAVLDNSELAMEYLIKYLSSIKTVDSNYLNLELISKISNTKLYIALEKLPNKNIFKPIFDKLKNNEDVIILTNKINMLGKKEACPICYDETTLIPMECAHFYCVNCYYKLKNCGFCKVKNKGALIK